MGTHGIEHRGPGQVDGAAQVQKPGGLQEQLRLALRVTLLARPRQGGPPVRFPVPPNPDPFLRWDIPGDRVHTGPGQGSLRLQQAAFFKADRRLVFGRSFHEPPHSLWI